MATDTERKQFYGTSRPVSYTHLDVYKRQPLLRTAFEKKMPLGDAVHRKLMRDFRLYMLVGGMRCV